jgi:hypothetical protein
LNAEEVKVGAILQMRILLNRNVMSLKADTNKDEIKFIGAGVGSGKTHQIIKDIQANSGKGHLYVVPTKKLSAEIEARLTKSDVKLDQPYFENIVRIDSETSDNVIRDVIIRINGSGKNGVTIITREAFHLLFIEMKNAPNMLRNYHLILDEGLKSAFHYRARLDADKIPLARSLFKEIEGQPEFYEINAAELYQVNNLLNGREDKFKGHKALHDSDNFMDMLRIVASGFFNVVMEFTNEWVRMAAALRVDVFDTVGSVTIVLANYLRTPMHKSLRASNDGRFKFIDMGVILKNQLRDTHKDKGHLISIGHILHPDDNASITNMDRELEGKFVWQHCCDAVEEFMPQRDGIQNYLYTLNQKYADLRTLTNGIRLPTINSGIDDYKRMHDVAVLSVLNIDPDSQELLAKVLGCPIEELYMDDSFNHAYQTVGRCSIRNAELDDPINMIVLSKSIADDLLKTFEGSTALGQVSELPSLKKIVNASRGENVSAAALERNRGNVWESKHYSAWKRYKLKCKRSGTPPIDRNDWYDLNYA